ncbi:hypothetical protein ACOMHN_062357 [Nucella lapillus]
MAEEKHAAEVRKLKRDLEAAQVKVHSLTSQLSTNSHQFKCDSEGWWHLKRAVVHVLVRVQRVFTACVMDDHWWRPSLPFTSQTGGYC